MAQLGSYRFLLRFFVIL